MKLSELAKSLADDVQDTLSRPLGDSATVTAVPMLTNKAMAEYGRKLEPGCVALRVSIVTDETMGELGKMELFLSVNKKRLKDAPGSVFASVMRFIMQSVEHRAEMLGQARERMATAV